MKMTAISNISTQITYDNDYLLIEWNKKIISNRYKIPIKYQFLNYYLLDKFIQHHVEYLDKAFTGDIGWTIYLIVNKSCEINVSFIRDYFSIIVTIDGAEDFFLRGSLIEYKNIFQSYMIHNIDRMHDKIKSILYCLMLLHLSDIYHNIFVYNQHNMLITEGL